MESDANADFGIQIDPSAFFKDRVGNHFNSTDFLTHNLGQMIDFHKEQGEGNNLVIHGINPEDTEKITAEFNEIKESDMLSAEKTQGMNFKYRGTIKSFWASCIEAFANVPHLLKKSFPNTYSVLEKRFGKHPEQDDLEAIENLDAYADEFGNELKPYIHSDYPKVSQYASSRVADIPGDEPSFESFKNTLQEFPGQTNLIKRAILYLRTLEAEEQNELYTIMLDQLKKMPKGQRDKTLEFLARNAYELKDGEYKAKVIPQIAQVSPNNMGITLELIDALTPHIADLPPKEYLNIFNLFWDGNPNSNQVKKALIPRIPNMPPEDQAVAVKKVLETKNLELIAMLPSIFKRIDPELAIKTDQTLQSNFPNDPQIAEGRSKGIGGLSKEKQFDAATDLLNTNPDNPNIAINLTYQLGSMDKEAANALYNRLRFQFTGVEEVQSSLLSQIRFFPEKDQTAMVMGILEEDPNNQNLALQALKTMSGLEKSAQNEVYSFVFNQHKKTPNPNLFEFLIRQAPEENQMDYYNQLMQAQPKEGVKQILPELRWAKIEPGKFEETLSQVIDGTYEREALSSASQKQMAQILNTSLKTDISVKTIDQIASHIGRLAPNDQYQLTSDILTLATLKSPKEGDEIIRILYEIAPDLDDSIRQKIESHLNEETIRRTKSY